MQKSFIFFRGVLWVVCLYHVLVGVVLNLPGTLAADLLIPIVGITKAPGEQAFFLARILGVYMLAFGIGMGLGAWDPVKNRAFITVGAFLVAIRALQRLLQMDHLVDAFGVEAQKNLGMALTLLLLALLLLAFRFALYKEMMHPRS